MRPDLRILVSLPTTNNVVASAASAIQCNRRSSHFRHVVAYKRRRYYSNRCIVFHEKNLSAASIRQSAALCEGSIWISRLLKFMSVPSRWIRKTFASPKWPVAAVAHKIALSCFSCTLRERDDKLLCSCPVREHLC